MPAIVSGRDILDMSGALFSLIYIVHNLIKVSVPGI